MSKSGHLPGHIRATFVAAVSAFVHWKGGDPEPNVELSYEPYHIPISRACGLVWNCSDTIPGNVFDQLRECGLHPRLRTYAGCARAVRTAIKKRQVVLMTDGLNLGPT